MADIHDRVLRFALDTLNLSPAPPVCAEAAQLRAENRRLRSLNAVLTEKVRFLEAELFPGAEALEAWALELESRRPESKPGPANVSGAGADRI